MGHSRLGPIPKSRKWAQVVERIATGGTANESEGLAGDVKAVAAQALDAARRGLDAAISDPGLRETLYVVASVVVAARSRNWATELASLGIDLSTTSDIAELTWAIQDAIDARVRASARPSDFSEMAQIALGEALSDVAGRQTLSLFEDARCEDLRDSLKKLSTQKGFGELGQRFFGRFMARFLNFHLSRITASKAGVPGLEQLGDHTRFNSALELHCEQSALIVRKFSGAWLGKAMHQGGISPQSTAGYVAIAVKKLQSELAKQGADQ